MSATLIAKCISVLIIFIGSAVCGLLPAFKVFSTFPRFALSLILSYGGGILIATSLVHILPEARESWPNIQFSPEMSLCIGIFIVYFIEEVAHFLVCHDLHSPLGHGDHDGHRHGVHVLHDVPPNRCDEPAAVYLFADEAGRSGEFGASNSYSSSNHNLHHHHSHSHRDGHGHGHGRECPGTAEQQVKLVSSKTSNDSSAIGSEVKQEASDPSIEKEDKKTIVAKLRSLVGLIALSVHAGLEGLSVGLGRQASEVWYLCGAIAAHKLVIAFCLGMEVRNASVSTCTVITNSSNSAFKFRYVLFFALMTPLGIAIGTIITEIIPDSHDDVESTLVAVLQTLAAGTLLYVAFFEVVLRERARFSGKGLAQLAFVIMGFATMSLVEIFIGHEHTHRDHCPELNGTSSISGLQSADPSPTLPNESKLIVV